MGSQQFCLKWNNHQMNLLAVFDQLLQNEAFVDVTLACEGVSLKAHKMVLSACSPYFQTLFLDNPCKHPIVILNSMRYIDLKAIIDFMYKGEVNVSQDQLSALLKTAEMLKVKGLAEVTNQTKQNMVASGVMPPLSTSPPLPHVGQRSPPHIRTSLSPPPKRKKLRTSAMSSAASSPQTPTLSSSVTASAAIDSTQPLEPKIVSQTSLADLSQDGHSDPDGLSRHSSAEQNSDSVPDLRLEPSLEIKEDHSPTTSNMASDMSYDTLPPDLGNAEHSAMDSSNLNAGPSTSGTQSQSSDSNQYLIPVIPVKCELSPDAMVTEEEIEQLRKQSPHIKHIPSEIAWSTQDYSMLGYPTAAPPWLQPDMLATALSAVRSGQLSISEVAQSFGMGRKTLHKQLVAFPRLPLKRGPKTLLTEEEERTVVDYIHSFTGRGTRPRRDEIIRYASAILQQKSGVPVSDGNGISSDEPTTSDAKTKVGIKWWKKFRARHPELRDMRGNIPRERPVIKLE